MEHENIPNKLIMALHRNLTDSYAAHLYKSRGHSITDAIIAKECEVIGKDCVSICTVSKDKIKEQVLVSNDVVLYLDVNLENISSDKIIKSPSYATSTLVPFICIGWSDYEYLTSINEHGRKIKNRGYLILCPLNKLPEEENYYFLPYKFVKGDENDEEKLIKEIWCFNDIEKSVIPFRSRITMKIGERIFKDNNNHYETDAVAYYHDKGNPMIPLRIIAERLGYIVTWNRRRKTITLTKGTNEIVVKPGENECTYNGTIVTTSMPVQIDKRTKRSYVTLGFIKCIFDCDTEFVREQELVKIYRKK